MTRVLIVYGTSEGHTRKVCAAMADVLRGGGAAVDVFQAGAGVPALHVYDGFIVAASVHAGRYQKAVVNWVRAHARELATRPTAFVSVCLAVLEKKPEVQAHLDGIVRQFCGKSGWEPAMIAQVAGALKYTQYGFFKRWIMKRIVASAGGDTDTSRDYEYTDWAAVRAFAEEFRRRLPAAAA